MKISALFTRSLVVASVGVAFLGNSHAVPLSVGQTVSYRLDVVDSLGSLSMSSYATVEMTQRNGAVDFVVAPNAGFLFANTNGPHFQFAFNLSSSFDSAAVSLTGQNASDFVVMSGSSFRQAPFGTFGHAIDFASSIRNGMSAAYGTPLTFTVSMSNLNIENFIPNSGGYRFAADLGQQSTGRTLNVAASESSMKVTAAAPANSSIDTPTKTPTETPIKTPTDIPEPTSVALFGLGLVAAAAVRRRKSQ